MNQTDFFKQAASLRKAGKSSQAISLIRDALRRGRLDPEGADRAGRFLQKEFAAGNVEGKPVRILLLGQCTTSWLATSLTAAAWSEGVCALVSEGGFDSIVQDLNQLMHGGEKPDVVVLLPWGSRLIANEAPEEDRIAGELSMWTQAWSMVKGGLGSRLLQVGYDWVVPGPLGSHLSARPGGPVHAIRGMNNAILNALPPGSYFLDLEQTSGGIGRNTFYDMRRYYWTKQPFSEEGTMVLSKDLWAGVRALLTGPKKVLVLDLDNTVWGGVVGETGPLGVSLGETADGEAYTSFQKHAKALAKRGIVLTVASKNNLADAREPFEKNPNMVLALDDLAAFEANWEPKGSTIARTAKTLSLGLDSFVFFDDNPAEREQVRQALPEVTVVEAPEDPAEYVRALESGRWFETTGLTDADSARAEQYTVERKRRELQDAFTSMDDYLLSLDMSAEIRPIDETEMQRVVQLLAKTNQFNLTTRRHTQEDVAAILAKPGSLGLTVRVKDKFGDYGLIAVVIGDPETLGGETVLKLDSWLMSCRVIGRTVEQFTMAVIIEKAKELGHARILGEFIPTKKNALVNKLYDDLGFSRLPAQGDETVRYSLELDGASAPKHFLACVDLSRSGALIDASVRS